MNPLSYVSFAHLIRKLFSGSDAIVVQGLILKIGACNMFLEMKNELLVAKKEVLSVTETFSKEIMHDFDSLSLKCTSELYCLRKANCMLKSGQHLSLDNRETITRRVNSLFKAEFNTNEVEDVLYFYSRAVLKRIDECISEMVATYSKYSQWVFHASAVPNLKFLSSSNNKPNAYFNEILNSIFACSYFHETALFLLRAITGCMYVIQSKVAIYPSTPVAYIDGDNLILNDTAYLYSMHIDGFIPVIDFKEHHGQYYIFFCGEWHLPKDNTPCIVEPFNSLPLEIFNKYTIFNYILNQDDHFKEMCELSCSTNDVLKVISLLSDSPCFRRTL